MEYLPSSASGGTKKGDKMEILKKLKNKEDFNSAIISADGAQIYIKLNKIYFETQNKYNITIDYNNGNRETKHNQTAEQAENILKKFKIISVEQ